MICWRSRGVTTMANALHAGALCWTPSSSSSLAAAKRKLCTAATATPSSAVDGTESKRLYRRLSALGGKPEGSVWCTMDQWVREGGPVSVPALMSDVRELRRYGRFRHALELMEWMHSRGIEMSCNNHAVRVQLLAKAMGARSAEEYFFDLPDSAKNHQTYGALLNVYCTEKMVNEATSLHARMKEMNYDLNKLVYNNLMSLYISLGQPEVVPSLFQEMRSREITPDAFTCSLLLNSYASLGDLESVDKSVEEMKEGDTSCFKWKFYSNLASIYISAGLIQKGEFYLKKLEEKMNRRDRAAFHYLISLYASTGNLNEVNRVWNSLKRSFQKPINMSYFVMLQALNRLNAINAMKQCFDEWNGSYTTYDIRLVNQLIGACLRIGMRKEAQSLLGNALCRGAEPSRRTYEIFIEYYLQNCEMGLAIGYVEAACLKLKDWIPDKKVVDASLRYIKENKDAVVAKAFCKRLQMLSCVKSDDNCSHDYTYPLET